MDEIVYVGKTRHCSWPTRTASPAFL